MKTRMHEADGIRGALISLIAALILLAPAGTSFALDLGRLLNNKPTEKDKFTIIGANGLAALIADRIAHVNIYDANGPSLRAYAGVIPGAHLLTSADKYDAVSSLPTDKNARIVFYCADPH